MSLFPLISLIFLCFVSSLTARERCGLYEVNRSQIGARQKGRLEYYRQHATTQENEVDLEEDEDLEEEELV